MAMRTRCGTVTSSLFRNASRSAIRSGTPSGCGGMRVILETPLPMDPETRELRPRLLRLAPRAKALLVAFSDAVEAQQAHGGDLSHVTGYASKAAEQACRIACVLTLWRDLNAPEVSEQEMAEGIELADFYLSEAARLANGATVSVEIDRAEKLRKWLLEKWPEAEVTTRDVVNKGPNELRETLKARAALGLLEKLKWLAPLSPGSVVRGSRRAEAWRIVREADNAV
ncbi:MAG: DUF3987 domain-containing protein [Cypionkella sp.]